MNNLVIWCDVYEVKLRSKGVHCVRKGNKILTYNRFFNDYGDVPVANFNNIANTCEAVVNNRGRAYAARKRQCYRKSIRSRRDALN